MKLRTRSKLALAAVVAALALPASAQAEPFVTAHLIYSDSDSQTWFGTCYSKNGRYAASVYHYLSRETRHLDFPTTWTVTLVSGTLSDFATGKGAKGSVYLTKWRYRGSDGYGPDPIGDWVKFADSYGTFSYFPERTTVGLLRARWWYHTDLREWYFDTHRQAIDFNNDGNTDCSVMFAYGYPWLAPPNQRPRR
jgi:hypothetical protein